MPEIKPQDLTFRVGDKVSVVHDDGTVVTYRVTLMFGSEPVSWVTNTPHTGEVVLVLNPETWTQDAKPATPSVPSHDIVITLKNPS